MQETYNVRIYDARGVVRCGTATKTPTNNFHYQQDTFTRRGITPADLPELEKIIQENSGVDYDNKTILAFEGSIKEMRELYENLRPIKKK